MAEQKIICGDSIIELKKLPIESIDMVLTSPPYDNLRDYKGYSFDFEGIARELFRVLKMGGVVVWVVGDATVNGSETGTSFKQALFFKEIGFNLWDTMIYHRATPYPANVRYNQCFEYMFVLSKGAPKTFNPIKVKKSDKSFHSFRNPVVLKTFRNKDGTTKIQDENTKTRLLAAEDVMEKVADNVWYIPAGYMMSTKDISAFEHPAIFPEKLAENHIISWTNKGDLVLDPFLGSGTTGKMAKAHGRQFIGIDISPEYIKLAQERISAQPDSLFT